MSVEEKIDKLLMEVDSSKLKKVLKNAGIASLGGIAGAGLDVYFNGGKNVDAFLKPVAAWGLGSALGGMLQDSGGVSKEPQIKEKKIKNNQ